MKAETDKSAIPSSRLQHYYILPLKKTIVYHQDSTEPWTNRIQQPSVEYSKAAMYPGNSCEDKPSPA